MTRIASLLLSIFLTISMAHASQDNPERQRPRVQVFANDGRGHTVPVMTQDDADAMASCMNKYTAEFHRISQEGALRGVPSSRAFLQASAKFKEEILMCRFNQLRGVAYIVLSQHEIELDNFAIAYSYALAGTDGSAAKLYQFYKDTHQRIADQFRPEVNETDALLKENVLDQIKRIDEIVNEEVSRHQHRLAEPTNPEFDHHPLEVRRLKQLETELTWRTKALIPRTAAKLCKITLLVVLMYTLLLKIV